MGLNQIKTRRTEEEKSLKSRSMVSEMKVRNKSISRKKGGAVEGGEM